MRPFDDYPDDMSDPLAVDDATAEALLAGRAAVGARPDLAPVSVFIAELRACRSVPVPAPSPALALLLRDGTTAATASTVPPPRVSVVSGWRRRLALAGVGLGAALTGVVGASAADLLPDPVQRVVTSVVETLTPLEMPDQADGTDEPAVSDPADGPAREVPPGAGGEPRDGGGRGGGAEPTSPTGTSPGPGGGPPVGGPAGPGGPTGAPGSGGVAVPDPPAPTAPGMGDVPSVPTTLPPTPPVTPPTKPGTPTVPVTPTAPQMDPSDLIPLPW